MGYCFVHALVIPARKLLSSSSTWNTVSAHQSTHLEYFCECSISTVIAILLTWQFTTWPNNVVHSRLLKSSRLYVLCTCCTIANWVTFHSNVWSQCAQSVKIIWVYLNFAQERNHNFVRWWRRRRRSRTFSSLLTCNQCDH